MVNTQQKYCKHCNSEQTFQFEYDKDSDPSMPIYWLICCNCCNAEVVN